MANIHNVSKYYILDNSTSNVEMHKTTLSRVEVMRLINSWKNTPNFILKEKHVNKMLNRITSYGVRVYFKELIISAFPNVDKNIVKILNASIPCQKEKGTTLHDTTSSSLIQIKKTIDVINFIDSFRQKGQSIPEAEIIRMSNRIKTETLHQYFITRCSDYNKGFGYIDLFKPHADETLTPSIRNIHHASDRKAQLCKHPKECYVELKELGYSSFLGNATFTNVDNIISKAKYKPNYEYVLILLLRYYDSGAIYNYVKNKYVIEYVKKELASKHKWTKNESYLVNLVKEETGILDVKKKNSFDFLNEKIYIIKWEDVQFRNGVYTIYEPQDGSIRFMPYEIHDKLSSTSLNYIRDYIQQKLPNIACIVKKGRLHIESPIDLSIAVRILQSPTYSKIVERRKALALRPKIKIFPDNGMLSFGDSMSKASKMSPEDFVKYKSKFINYLLKMQIADYKVIPCNENISHRNTANIIENAFIFTLQSKCDTKAVIVVVENLNPDRATLLFKIKKNSYEESLKVIHSFLKSPEINKRSNLRESMKLISMLKSEDFYAVNHRDEGPYPWSSTMDYRLRTM